MLNSTHLLLDATDVAKAAAEMALVRLSPYIGMSESCFILQLKTWQAVQPEPNLDATEVCVCSVTSNTSLGCAWVIVMVRAEKQCAPLITSS